MLRFAEEQRDVQRTQRVDLPFGVAVPPDDDQVRLQHGDPLEVERLVVADARHGLRGGRIVAVRDGADQLRAAASRVDQLGRMRRETDHALRRRRQRDGIAGIVVCRDVGMSERRERDECYERR